MGYQPLCPRSWAKSQTLPDLSPPPDPLYPSLLSPPPDLPRHPRPFSHPTHPPLPPLTLSNRTDIALGLFLAADARTLRAARLVAGSAHTGRSTAIPRPLCSGIVKRKPVKILPTKSCRAPVGWDRVGWGGLQA